MVALLVSGCHGVDAFPGENGSSPTVGDTSSSAEPSKVASDPPLDVGSTPPAVASSDSVGAVVMTTAHWDAVGSSVQVSAYVEGRVSEVGECRLTVTAEGIEFVAAVPATADAMTTTCGLIVLEGFDHPPEAGPITVLVTFVEGETSLTSETWTVSAS